MFLATALFSFGQKQAPVQDMFTFLLIVQDSRPPPLKMCGEIYRFICFLIGYVNCREHSYSYKQNSISICYIRKMLYLNFFYIRRFITGILKKGFGEILYKTSLYLMFGYIRSPYYKGFPDFNLIIYTRLKKNTVKYDLQHRY